MATEAMVVGERIRRLLEQKGLSRKEFCAMTGLTEAALCRYINGQREPKAITLSVIARGLDVSMDELLGTPCEDPSKLEDAIKLVARSKSTITEEQKKELLSVIISS